ncbi:hypothetical protein RKD32_005952 [Streptomyces sp. SAI-195]
MPPVRHAVGGEGGAQHRVAVDQAPQCVGERLEVECVGLEALVALAAFRGSVGGGRAGDQVRLLEGAGRTRVRGRLGAGGGEGVPEGREGGLHGAGGEPGGVDVPAVAQGAVLFPHLVVEGDVGGLADPVLDGRPEAAGDTGRRADVEQAGEDDGGRGLAGALSAQRLDSGDQAVPQVFAEAGVDGGRLLVEGFVGLAFQDQDGGRGERAHEVLGPGGQVGAVAGGDHQGGAPLRSPAVQRLGEQGEHQGGRRDAEPQGPRGQRLPLVGGQFGVERAAFAAAVGGGGCGGRGDQAGPGRQPGQLRVPVGEVGAVGVRAAFGQQGGHQLGDGGSGGGQRLLRVVVAVVPLLEQHRVAVAVGDQGVEAEVDDVGAGFGAGDLHGEQRPFAGPVAAVREAGADGVAVLGVAGSVHGHPPVLGGGADVLEAVVVDDRAKHAVLVDQVLPGLTQPTGVEVVDGELAVQVAADRLAAQVASLGDQVGLLEVGDRERLPLVGADAGGRPRGGVGALSRHRRGQLVEGGGREPGRRQVEAELAPYAGPQPGQRQRGEAPVGQSARWQRFRSVRAHLGQQPVQDPNSRQPGLVARFHVSPVSARGGPAPGVLAQEVQREFAQSAAQLEE